MRARLVTVAGALVVLGACAAAGGAVPSGDAARLSGGPAMSPAVTANTPATAAGASSPAVTANTPATAAGASSPTVTASPPATAAGASSPTVTASPPATAGGASSPPVQSASTTPASTLAPVPPAPAAPVSAASTAPVAVGPVDALRPDPGATTTTTTPPPGTGIALDPTWPATLTVLTDSVVLGAERALPEGFTGWQVEVLGKPALMVKHAVRDLLPGGRTVGSVVVVGLGYNSLWEPDRANFDRRAERFDAEAEALVAELRARGANKIVWVTLREATPENVPAKWQKQHRKYSWYFPYVNERLWALAERHPDIAIADWAAVANRPDITYDAMHLNPAGARLMTEVIRGAVGA